MLTLFPNPYHTIVAMCRFYRQHRIGREKKKKDGLNSIQAFSELSNIDIPVW